MFQKGVLKMFLKYACKIDMASKIGVESLHWKSESKSRCPGVPKSPGEKRNIEAGKQILQLKPL